MSKQLRLAILVAISIVLSAGIALAYHWSDRFKPCILAVELIEGKLEVHYKQDTGFRYCEGGLSPDSYRVWKDVYCAKDGRIVFEEKVEGRYVPPKITTMPERLEWPEP